MSAREMHRGRHPHHASHLPSLLWPHGRPDASRKAVRVSPQAAADLDIEPLVGALAGRQAHRARFVSDVLLELPTDPAVLSFRADLISNLLEEPDLRARLDALLPLLTRVIEERQRPIFGTEWTAGEIVDRLGDLEMYVDAALGLAHALEGTAVHAPALERLRDAVNALVRTSEFKALEAELPALKTQLEGVQSVTIGVNVSHDLRPESATILSIDPEKVEGRGGLLSRLFGRSGSSEGVTRLRGSSGTFRGFFPPMAPSPQGYENELVADLQRLLDRIVTPIGEAIERYVWVHTRDFAALEAELSFVLNGVALIGRLHAAGLPTCRPEIAPLHERTCCIEDVYNVCLALRTVMAGSAGESGTGEIVTNRVMFGDTSARVWILTGPNRGGKTTYVRAIGLAQLLLGTGLPVPARAACMSPIDGLWTHFPTPETTTPGEGRLDDEAIRLADIFREATPHSLILLNEVLTGTSTLEALALAYDAVRGLRLLGARAIYVTHLHELAGRVDEINASTGGDGTVGSLVAEVDRAAGNGAAAHRRTFKIHPSPPLGVSYASEIAEQHGISYAQLLDLLEQRGVLRES